MSIKRRSFLKQATALTAAPLILPARAWSAKTKPNDRIGMGFVGMGTQNFGLLSGFLPLESCRVVAVCEVDTTRREAAQGWVNRHYERNPELGSPDCKAYVDYRDLIARDDIDVVCIATPDHWHAIVTLEALRAGKDVYCEKPLTHNINEAIAVMKAVDANKRVLQTGSMQRSMKEFRIACELVRNGLIGKVSRVECTFGLPAIPYNLPEEEMEPGLDWDMWIGPAPMCVYNSVLSPRGLHVRKWIYPDWRRFREFGGGGVTDWGAHHLDIAQWGLGMDESGPDEIHPPDDSNATHGAVLKYGSDVEVHHMADGFGVHFFGSDGEVKVNRGRFEFYLDGKKVAGFVTRKDGGSLESALYGVEKDFLADAKVKLYKSANHLWDFVDCVKARTKPIAHEEIGGRSVICCHLMNQAYYNHAVIKWNPKEMTFAEGTGDPAWLTREYRPPWKI